jgi:hypothetical protein
MGGLPGPIGCEQRKVWNGIGMRVLEAPGGPEARRLMKIAARIRKKRAARNPVPFPESREDRLRVLLERGVFRSVGLFPSTWNSRGSAHDALVLARKPEKRVMVAEWVREHEDVNMDHLLSRYLRVYENLNNINKRSAGNPVTRFPSSTMLPGIVLILEEKRDVRRLEQALKLISRIPVEVYSLHRKEVQGGETRIVLESEDGGSSGTEGVFGTEETCRVAP